MYSQKGWTMAFIVVGIIVAAASVITVMGTKERIHETGKKGKGTTDASNPAGAVKSLFKNKYWVILTICMFLIFFVIVMYVVAAIYYAQYVLGDAGYYTAINNAISVAQFGIMFITPFFMKRFGKHKIYQFGLLFLMVGFAGTGLSGTNIPLLIFFNAVKGLGLGAAGGMAFGMISDTIDYGQWKTGIDQHLKLSLEVDGREIQAIWFRHKRELPPTVRLAYKLDINDFRGRQSVQLIIEGMEDEFEDWTA